MKLSSLLVFGFISANNFSSAQNTCNGINITNKCPEWNFNHHQEMLNVNPRYNMEVQNIQYERDNTYDITIRVYADEYIALKYLHSLKVIGVHGPQGTVQLWGQNEGVTPQDFVPSDFTSTFKVYADPTDNSCNVQLPSFQIQYEYDYSEEWAANGWGQTHFDLMVGCGGDNQGNSNFDFPSYIWPKDCDSNCGIDPNSSIFPNSTTTLTSAPKTSVSIETNDALPKETDSTDPHEPRSIIPFPILTTTTYSPETTNTLPMETIESASSETIVTSPSGTATSALTDIATTNSSQNAATNVRKTTTANPPRISKSSLGESISESLQDTTILAGTNTVTTESIADNTQQAAGNVPTGTSNTISTEITTTIPTEINTVISQETTTSISRESSTNSSLLPMITTRAAPKNSSSSQLGPLYPQNNSATISSETIEVVSTDIYKTKSHPTTPSTTTSILPDIILTETSTAVPPETITVKSQESGANNSRLPKITTRVAPKNSSSSQLEPLFPQNTSITTSSGIIRTELYPTTPITTISIVPDTILTEITTTVPTESITVISQETTTIILQNNTSIVQQDTTISIPQETYNNAPTNTAAIVLPGNTTIYSKETARTSQADTYTFSKQDTGTADSFDTTIPRLPVASTNNPSESTTITPNKIRSSVTTKTITFSTSNTCTFVPTEKTKSEHRMNTSIISIQNAISASKTTTINDPVEIISSVTVKTGILNTNERFTSAPTANDGASTNKVGNFVKTSSLFETICSTAITSGTTGQTGNTKTIKTGSPKVESKDTGKRRQSQNIGASAHVTVSTTPSKNPSTKSPLTTHIATTSTRVTATIDVNIDFQGVASSIKGSMVMIMLSLLLII